MVKIKISYTEDAEAKEILFLLNPIINRFKLKEDAGKKPYKHVYLNPKKRNEHPAILP